MNFNMRYIGFLFYFLFVFLAINTFALSENEWQKLYNTSTIFKISEQELNKIWNEKYKSMPESPEKKALLEDQKLWIKKGRDLSAQAYIQSGMGFAQAYAQATFERVAYLKEYHLKQKQNYATRSKSEQLHKDSDEVVIHDFDYYVKKNNDSFDDPRCDCLTDEDVEPGEDILEKAAREGRCVKLYKDPRCKKETNNKTANTLAESSTQTKNRETITVKQEKESKIEAKETLLMCLKKFKKTDEKLDGASLLPLHMLFIMNKCM